MDMPLVDTLWADKKAALKTGRKAEFVLLGVVIGNITTKESRFNPRRALTEGEVVEEVKGVLNGIELTLAALTRDSASIEALTRQAKVAELEVEKQILTRYLPMPVGDQQIRSFATAAKADGRDMKFIMNALKLQFPGQYDGSVASRIVKEVLAGG